MIEFELMVGDSKEGLKKQGPLLDWMLPENRNNLEAENHGTFGRERIKAEGTCVTGKEAVIGHVGKR